MSVAAATRSFLRSRATVYRRRTQTQIQLTTQFTISCPQTKTPLSSYFRSPVELSFCVETMLTYHTTTASALLTSMLSVSPRIYGWASEGNSLAFST
ncbi:hypothetical protein Q3G72_012358 [Acer saccharum]|nr:hypothetical protein Q3G72_012358 [Acer saccharum]